MFYHSLLGCLSRGIEGTGTLPQKAKTNIKVQASLAHSGAVLKHSEGKTAKILGLWISDNVGQQNKRKSGEMSSGYLDASRIPLHFIDPSIMQ